MFLIEVLCQNYYFTYLFFQYVSCLFHSMNCLFLVYELSFLINKLEFSNSDLSILSFMVVLFLSSYLRYFSLPRVTRVFSYIFFCGGEGALRHVELLTPSVVEVWSLNH